MAKGKKYRDAARRYDREMFHGPREALELVKSLATKNFDESIDLVVRLGVDPRKADQMVRGTVSHPHPGKEPLHGLRHRPPDRRTVGTGAVALGTRAARPGGELQAKSSNKNIQAVARRTIKAKDIETGEV